MSSNVFRTAQQRLNSYVPTKEEEEEEQVAEKPISIFAQAQRKMSDMAPEKPMKQQLEQKPQQQQEAEQEQEQQKQETPQEEGGWWEDLKKFVTSPEPNAFEQGIGKALGIAGRGIAKAAGTPADLGTLATYYGQSILRDTFPEAGYGPIPQVLQDYSGEGLAKKYDVATGAKFQPEGILENLLEKGIEFGASGPLFEGKAALKGGNALRNLLAGLGSGAAEQAEAGPLGQIGGAIAGGAVPSVSKAFRPQAIKESIAKGIGKATAGQTDTAVRKAALEEGLTTLPASVQSESKAIKQSEKYLTQNPFAGAKFEESLSNLENQVADNFVKKVGNGVQDTYENAISTGQTAQDFIKDIYKTTEEYFGKAYESVKHKAKGFKIFPKNYENNLNGLEKSLEKTLAESPEKASVLKDIREMQSKLYDTVTEKKAIFNPETKLLEIKDVKTKVPKKFDLEQLVNTRTDLNSVYNRIKEFKGAQKFRKTFPKAINEDLEQLKVSHPKVYDELKNLDKQYGQHRESFNNKIIKSIRNEERPEVIVGLIKQPSDFDRVAKIMNQTPNGKKVLEAVKQAKLQEKFSEQFLNARNGTFDYKRYKTLLNMPQIDKWVNKLASPDQIKSIKNLQKVSEGFTKGERYLRGDHDAIAKMKAAGITVQIAQGIGSLASGNPLRIMSSAAGLLGPRMLASIYSDPELIKIMLNTAQAGNKNNMKSYVSGMRKIGKRILQAIEVSPEELEESRK